MADEAIKKPESKGTMAERTRDRRTYIPRVDIYSENENLYLVADMPGADESTVSITLDKDVLTIEGTVDEPTSAGRKLSHGEYGIGDYYRAFTLSEEIDREKIEASMKNGVLRVCLPKAEPHKTKKIAIHAGL
ncbi:MAG: Hsp20/alpha crystallin family protein [Syntrophaceae bacterium]